MRSPQPHVSEREAVHHTLQLLLSMFPQPAVIFITFILNLTAFVPCEGNLLGPLQRLRADLRPSQFYDYLPYLPYGRIEPTAWDEEPELETHPVDIEAKNLGTVVIVTLGTRGDVQPYIPLCKDLERNNIKCYIASHEAHQDFADNANVSFIGLPGTAEEIRDLMEDLAEHPMLSFQTFRDNLKKHKRDYSSNLITEGWDQIAKCRPDILLSVPWFFAGRDIAKILGIPYFNIQVFPSTSTPEFPHFMVIITPAVYTK
jgi:hypothetical protein